MKIKISKISKIPEEKDLGKNKHNLIIMDLKQKKIPFEALLKAKLSRAGKKSDDLKKKAVTTELANGSVVSWVVASEDINTFQMHALLRNGFANLLLENPESLNVIVCLRLCAFAKILRMNSGSNSAVLILFRRGGSCILTPCNKFSFITMS